ncbi:response regulator [Scytonema sp. UIC 10036]|uniref:hybrid sensor histidine kinase/response regulator n=1 Tax=Scytonema sp. UIC 10036 TaxID=2304196 RepID=UPI0012DA63E0|nr:response regulator [Scytonema sp. UIC 10036]MUG93952.1 response regulator [Scytonema sp. UIC 10036]
MLRLLLIDDNEHDRTLIIYRLRCEFPDLKVEQVTQAEDFQQALEAGHFELVITDYRLRWNDGLTVLRDIKSRYPNCPVIMFTDSGSEEIAVEAMKTGLDDYIIKSAKHYVRLPVAVRSILQRLEQQQRAEKALQEANQRSADILESITDAFCALDEQFRFTYINQKLEQILLKTQAELLGKNIWEEYPEAIDSVCYQKYHEAATTKLPVQFEAFCPHLDMWLEVRVYPQADGLTIYSHDISDRKRSELEREQFLAREQAARAEAEAQERRSTFLAEASRLLASSLDYHTTLSHVASIAVPTLADWCFVDIVEKNLTVFNEPIIVASDPEKEALIRELRQRYPPPADADFGAPKVLRTGQPEMATEISEVLLLSIAQDDRHLSLLRQLNAQSYMLVPLIVGDRKLGTIAFTSAQPERRYQKADLAMATEVAQRAAIAIDNARLYREAWEANRIKDEFLAIVSHELRTPLNSILGWAKMLRQRKLNQATATKALETIERNAELQTKLIEDILDVSRIVQGKIRLNLRPLYLKPVIEAVVENTRPSAEAKAVQVGLVIDPNVGQVTGDADRLQQIVWNLLSNAVKFSPSGGRVEIRLEQVNSMAQITVSDTGAGISADFLPYVFERFRQADGSTTRANGGLGLGLAIVRHLVEMHNGTVYAASDGEGLGATFTVQLPIIEEQIVQQTPMRLNSNSEFPSLNGLRILIVDDNVDTLELITFILEQCQAQVKTATSASDAISIFLQFKPEVLISDIGMPGEDGYSLIQKIRTLPPEQNGQVPAAALTAFAGESESSRALAAGFQIHISKPVDPTELVAAIVKLAKLNGQV